MLQEIKQLLAEEEIRRIWRWVVHTVWESSNCITKQALTCCSEGKWERERIKNTVFREKKAR